MSVLPFHVHGGCPCVSSLCARSPEHFHIAMFHLEGIAFTNTAHFTQNTLQSTLFPVHSVHFILYKNTLCTRHHILHCVWHTVHDPGISGCSLCCLPTSQPPTLDSQRAFCCLSRVAGGRKCPRTLFGFQIVFTFVFLST